jgi:dinuclear metal center YbgI/SA1388 family protein
MGTTITQAIASFEKLWPTHLIEDWDVVGLVSGSPSQSISKVLLTVDVTSEVVEYAKQVGADLIFAHHPLLLRGVTSVAEDTSKGLVVSGLIKSGIALYTAHTNADSVATGTSAAITSKLNLKNTRVLSPSKEPGLGIGIVGSLPNTLSLGELAQALNNILPPTATGVRVAGAFDRKVSTVAFCAGAGESDLELALDSGADVYITSDVRHHRAQEILELAKARGVEFSLVDISHWAAEFVWLETAQEELQEEMPLVNFEICDIRTDVFDFLMNKPKDL